MSKEKKKDFPQKTSEERKNINSGNIAIDLL